jgi:radical SAM protein with 4Fe4S-binding SPASM domain
MRLVLVTNGSAVDERVVSKLRKFGERVRVGVSLDGASAKVHDGIRGRSGSFREARAALDRLRGAGLECGAITTVMKQNIGELPGLRDLLVGKDLGWQIQIAGGSGGRFDRKWFLAESEFHQVGRFIDECRRNFSLAELPVAGAHDIGYFSKRLRRYGVEPQENWRGCVAGLSVIGITSDGGVKGCLSLPDASREGNVRERSLTDIWRDGALFARNRRFNIGQLTGFCRTCEFASKCRGGCQEMCLSTTGSAWSNRFCLYRLETKRGDVAHSGDGR